MCQTGDIVTKSMKEREIEREGEGGERDDNAPDFSIDTVFPTTQ